ncbi:Hypothetical protein, putative, partial [Bodo saltans]
MVCVKLLVVDVDTLLAMDGDILKKIKKKYPNIAQLFHFRKSHHVHFVGPATTQLEIVDASNDVYIAGGEPFAFTAEQATLFVSFVLHVTADRLEHFLNEAEIFGANERFARDDRERPGWRLSGPMYGVCAATSERRRELMNQCITKINEAYSTTFALMAEAFRVYVGTPFFSETAQTITQAAWGGDTWSASHMTTTTATIAHHHPLHTTTPRPVTLLPQQHQQPSSHLYATGLPQHPPPSHPSPLWYPTPHDNTNNDKEFPTTVHPTTVAAHPSAPVVAAVVNGVNWSSSSASVVVVAPAQQQMMISNTCLHPPAATALAQQVDASSSLSLYQTVDPVVALVSPAVV